jgi:hypothetical protein
VADDGGAQWSSASCEAIEYEDRRELLVLLRSPGDIDGWLTLGGGQRTDGELLARAEELRRHLRVLQLYTFAAACGQQREACEASLAALADALRASKNLRRRMYIAVLQANAETEMDRLHAAAAHSFLAQVSARDFNFDREGYEGFEPGAVARTARRCPSCGGALFVSIDRWRADETYARRKDTCCNCLGISMVPVNAALEIAPPTVRAVGPGTLEATLRMANTSSESLRGWIAAAPRHGQPESFAGPEAVELAPGVSVERTLRLALKPDVPGTRSLRFFAIAQATAYFHSVHFAGGIPPASDAAPLQANEQAD